MFNTALCFLIYWEENGPRTFQTCFLHKVMQALLISIADVWVMFGYRLQCLTAFSHTQTDKARVKIALFSFPQHQCHSPKHRSSAFPQFKASKSLLQSWTILVTRQLGERGFPKLQHEFWGLLSLCVYLSLIPFSLWDSINHQCVGNLQLSLPARGWLVFCSAEHQHERALEQVQADVSCKEVTTTPQHL